MSEIKGNEQRAIEEGLKPLLLPVAFSKINTSMMRIITAAIFHAYPDKSDEEVANDINTQPRYMEKARQFYEEHKGLFEREAEPGCFYCFDHDIVKHSGSNRAFTRAQVKTDAVIDRELYRLHKSINSDSSALWRSIAAKAGWHFGCYPQALKGKYPELEASKQIYDWEEKERTRKAREERKKQKRQVPQLNKQSTKPSTEALQRHMQEYRQTHPQPQTQTFGGATLFVSDTETEWLRTLSYKEFLNTTYWHVVRAQKIEQQPHCALCTKTRDLHVHHRTYENHGQEHKHLDDLVVLCAACHAKFHDKS